VLPTQSHGNYAAYSPEFVGEWEKIRHAPALFCLSAATQHAWKSPGEKFAVWNPPLSHIRIEYSRDLVRSLARGEKDPDSSGLLYGHRIAGGVRALSLKPRKGLRVVGSFAARARGEIFLTESDVERLDSLDAKAVALVIAADRAGFFVRQPGGSIQTIQSYQEFPIRPPRLRNPPPAWLPLAISSALSLAILLWPTQSFSIEPHGGALNIKIHRPIGLLEISDGPARRSIPLSPNLTSILYAPETSDVHVRLIR